MGSNDCDESEDNNSHSNVADKMVREVVGEIALDKQSSNDNTIHSGHFMLSNLDDEDDGENTTKTTQKIEGYDFETANKVTKESYEFGANKKAADIIDGSLTKLFQCMSLAYR